MQNVTLEMSLKPFKSVDAAYVARVCEKIFRQWRGLAAEAETVSVMLWTADGSEILDYKGRMDDRIEWARYIGGANPPPPEPGKPPRTDLHGANYLYMPNPPEITYATLKRIVATLKEVGRRVLDKPIRVGATFDPGPEFAKSPFKYQRHREICMGNTMGYTLWVCCYATLNEDHEPYAGWPQGIPQGTPFGTFFGRQCQHFLADLDFDFIWFSNGFGFGRDTWNATGAVFDGETFHTERVKEIRDVTLAFWRLFRAECPQFQVQTRGTNMSTGVDLASDAVPLKAIYEGGFNMLPPPNSPWAALDGDFGIELAGYMSHIAKLPDRRYMFRYYVHDPWWLNSPWLDRYGRQPHDIYLPLSVARIDAAGRVCPPTHVSFLTIDDSYGNLPDQCPNEVVPHVLHALATAPDQPSPLVWVYPFDEYHEILDRHEDRVPEPYFGDWFIRGAINNGLPLNSVVATDHFIRSRAARPELYDQSVIVTPVPDAGSALEADLLQFVQTGGQAILYGPTRHAGQRLRDLLGVKLAAPLAGELDMRVDIAIDRIRRGGYAGKICHREVLCAGGMEEIPAGSAPGVTVYATAGRDRETRVAALARRDAAWNGGTLAWVRGTSSNSLIPGQALPQPDDSTQRFNGEILMRLMLSELGCTFGFVKAAVDLRSPYNLVSRRDNGFYFSGYAPNTTVVQRLRFPQGAPLMIGLETEIVAGCATYSMARSWHYECRVFVEQEADSILSCVEQPTVMVGLHRRLYLTGFRDATLSVFLPEGIEAGQVEMLLNPRDPANILLTEEEQSFVPFEPVADKHGRHFRARGVTGSVLLSW
ncbi:MAG: hypothetical protein ACLQVA_06885 [Candidatus Brocadiia bacterium]